MPTPLNSYAQAAQAYTQARRGVEAPALAPGPAAEGGDGEFAALVKGALREAERIGKRAEALTVAGVTDRADLDRVVGAVAEAEVTLQTVVTVRDKVIDAYKEILRMPI